MRRVKTILEETEIDNDDGQEIAGLMVTCDRCGYTVKVYGTSDASARRGAIMLREGCPEDEENFYVVDE